MTNLICNQKKHTNTQYSHLHVCVYIYIYMSNPSMKTNNFVQFFHDSTIFPRVVEKPRTSRCNSAGFIRPCRSCTLDLKVIGMFNTSPKQMYMGVSKN